MRTLVKIKDFDKMQKKKKKLTLFSSCIFVFLGRKNTVSEAKYMATKFSYKF